MRQSIECSTILWRYHHCPVNFTYIYRIFNERDICVCLINLIKFFYRIYFYIFEEGVYFIILFFSDAVWERYKPSRFNGFFLLNSLRERGVIRGARDTINEDFIQNLASFLLPVYVPLDSFDRKLSRPPPYVTYYTYYTIFSIFFFFVIKNEEK